MIYDLKTETLTCFEETITLGYQFSAFKRYISHIYWLSEHRMYLLRAIKIQPT